jgi:hypothetical protein
MWLLQFLSVAYEVIATKGEDGKWKLKPQFKVAIPTLPLLALLFGLAHFDRSKASKGVYIVYEVFEEYRVVFGFAGMLAVAIGSVMKDSVKLRTGLWIIGLLAMAGALMVPRLPISRQTDPSVIIISSKKQPAFEEQIAKQLQTLKHGKGVRVLPQMNPVTDQKDVLSALGQVAKLIPDLVVVDFPNPFENETSETVAALLNPRTLYIFTEHIDLAPLAALPNVVALFPPLATEVLAIIQLVPTNAPVIEVYRSPDATGLAAMDMFMRILPPQLRLNVLKQEAVEIGKRVSPRKGAVVVVLDWVRSPRDLLEYGTGDATIIAGSHAELEQHVVTPKQIHLVGIRATPGSSVLHLNQELLLMRLVQVHFQNGRPLDPRKTLLLAREDIEKSLLLLLSPERVSYPYAGLRRNL